MPTGSDGADKRFVSRAPGWRRALATRDEIAERLRSGLPARVPEPAAG